MAVLPGTNGFAVRALEALRGELRSRTRLSNRPHAPPEGLATTREPRGRLAA